MPRVSTIRQMIAQEAPSRFDVGIVESIDPRGSRTVSVRLSGGRVCTRAITCTDDVAIGDRVFVVHDDSMSRVMIVARLLGEYESSLSQHGILAPPSNLTALSTPGAILLQWDTYPGEDLCWQVRWNTSASETGVTNVLVSRGSYYISRVVTASTDTGAAVTRYFQVRAIRWLGDNNVMFSAWSAWVNATSCTWDGRYYTETEIAATAAPSGASKVGVQDAANYFTGTTVEAALAEIGAGTAVKNLYDIKELEFNDATELTIAAGVVTRAQVYHSIDTQGDIPSDDLDTINGGSQGDVLLVRPANGARTVVIKHNTGNIWVPSLADISLDDINDHALLVYDGSMWCVVGWVTAAGAGGAHDILSVTHTDSDPNAVQRGDLMTGQNIGGVDKWSRFPLGPLGWLLYSTGLDVSWINPSEAGVVPNHDHSGNAGDGGKLDWDDVWSDAVHSHVSNAEGGKLDWDDIWSDAAHNHSAAGEGGQLDWDDIWSDAVHDHSAAGEGGQLDWDSIWSDAVHSHGSAAEGGDDITPNAIGVATTVPNQDGAIAQAEVAADPAGGGAGTTRIYSKDVAGQSKYFFVDDAGKVFELTGIAENLTVTVGAGKDFTTVQGAIDWLKNWLLKGTNYIDADAGTYVESVSITGIVMTPGATLTLRGDTRVLAGLAYIDGGLCNPGGLTNGGSGACALSIDGTRTVITITGATTNPDFDADNWVNGDTVLVYADDGAWYSRTVFATLNNAIALTVALPVGATVGNDGTAIVLLPNRAIVPGAGAALIIANGLIGVQIDGFYLYGTTNGLRINRVGTVPSAANVVLRGTTYGAYLTGGRLVASGGAVTFISGSGGLVLDRASEAQVQYAQAITGTYGFWCYSFSLIDAPNTCVSACATNYGAYLHSVLNAATSRSRVGTTGYLAGTHSYISATSTSANNTSSTPYTPAASDTLGNNLAGITWS